MDSAAPPVLRTPLVRLEVEAPAEIYLKLESLQAVGSFKIRGALQVMAQLTPDELREGVWTASAGNMARALAWCAHQRNIPCTVVVPDTAPAAKVEPVKALGARVVPVANDVFFETFASRSYPGVSGTFVHAFSDERVQAGNGMIGLEILEDLPDVEAILVPYGGGGLSCGIAAAIQGVAPQVRVYACEPDTAAPLAASLAAGRPVEPARYERTFIDGAGGPRVYPEMYELASRLLAGSIQVPVNAVEEAIRVLARSNHVVAEGAGALSVAAALAGGVSAAKICCVVSGGNIDLPVLAGILGTA